MSVIEELSSQKSDPTETANKRVAGRCLRDPKLLQEIAAGLNNKSLDLLADCTEVMTLVAQTKPSLAKPYAKQIIALLEHKKTKVRWEATHALSLLAQEVPQLVDPIVSKLKVMALFDDSTIVRDYSTWTIANYAQTSKAAARIAVPALQLILEEWKDKQAAKVIQGFIYALEQDPGLRPDIVKLAAPYQRSTKGIVKKVIKQLNQLTA